MPSCFTYVLIAIACGLTAWDLRDAYQDPMVVLALIALSSATAYMLTKVWTDCREPLMVLDKHGISCRKYGMVPWTAVEGVKLSVGPFGNGGEFSNLFLSVRDPGAYRVKLPRLQYLFERFLDKRITELKNAIVINLDGFYQKPSYIFTLVEQLHQQAMPRLKTKAIKNAEDVRAVRWKQVVYIFIEVVGTGALLIALWGISRR